MCGIIGVINLRRNSKEVTGKHLVEATSIINHRGPDDSGYFILGDDNNGKVLADHTTAQGSIEFFDLDFIQNDRFKIALGHKRLSILDLSPLGHQPMRFNDWVISFNGEVYNYLEIKDTLIGLGRKFQTQSDTEVIIQAWDEWGVDALQRFNGMFAFLLLNVKNQQLFVVRDRFGVKPLYYTFNENYCAFVSEVKQLRVLPDYKFQLNHQIAFDYLGFGFLDHSKETFEQSIFQLEPGHYIELNINDPANYRKHNWYKLRYKAFNGSQSDAVEEFERLLKDAVRLRLRSDVPVGSALSGGLDSSAIVCIMRQLLNEEANQGKVLETVTSCSKDLRFDESKFADLVIRATQSKSHKIFPDFEKLTNDLEKLIWHMDYPFGSTSQFSQWSVFEQARKAGLTVMIDGQGADEQLAGYGGNDLPLYTGLLNSFRLNDLLREIDSYKVRFGVYPKGFLLGALQYHLPNKIKNLFPENYRPGILTPPNWLNNNGFKMYPGNFKSLRANLYNQLYFSPLPSLLRYEDRNSMAFSVESRTPFMDYRLIEFTHSLPENLIYRNGERKYILRHSFRGLVPDEILDRRDKMGFVSAEERWLREDGKDWFVDQLKKSIDTEGLINDMESLQTLDQMQNYAKDFNFEIWRILNFKLWMKSMT
ncbi:asparagine synthase (glutamine-hydrolyzing) [Mongoliitalea lutea]|uniref:asparagine synthase (glutamine-hydrolyzing) n=1 Tax=Mongoliitalea lutea TaxID=849756 RepID=A0A8J3CWV6_9BACT|nr:asparagine synthase (glutamine-hydrolyzing) [Mongoliitalea lutea]GHB31408.1 asparagine synthetase B [Mongoliitalea lutea]